MSMMFVLVPVMAALVTVGMVMEMEDLPVTLGRTT